MPFGMAKPNVSEQVLMFYLRPRTRSTPPSLAPLLLLPLVLLLPLLLPLLRLLVPLRPLPLHLLCVCRNPAATRMTKFKLNMLPVMRVWKCTWKKKEEAMI